MLDFYKTAKIYKLIGVCIIGLVLILIGGLRWETGTDWINYHYYFESNDNYEDFTGSDFEYLYALLSYVVKSIFNSYTVFLLIFCFLIISIKLYGFCKISDYKFIFITILFYYANQLGDVSPTRQSMALSFGVLGFSFLINRRLILFLICSTIAFYCHSSAIICFLAIPLMYFEISRGKLIVFILSGFALGMVISISGSNNFIFSFIMGGGGHFAERLTTYQDIQEIGNSSTGSAIDPKVSYILGLIRRCFVLLPALVFYKKLSLNKNFKPLLNIYVVGSLIYLIFTPIIQVLNRMSAYFDVAEFLILPLFTTIPKRRYLQFAVYFILIIYAFAKFYSTIIAFWSFYTPYKLCF